MNEVHKPKPEIHPEIQLAGGEMGEMEVHMVYGATEVLSRHKSLVAVWCYAGALCVLLGSIEFFMLRSFELLLPIIGICAAGGLIGTYFAMFEENT